MSNNTITSSISGMGDITPDKSILFFSTVYYLSSCIILIASWAKKEYDGIHSGHMNMFFSLIITSYSLLYIQGKKNNFTASQNTAINVLVFIDVLCTGFIALTTTKESLHIFCKHAVDKKKIKKVDDQDSPYVRERVGSRKKKDYLTKKDIEYTKVKDPLSNINEPTAILVFILILIRFAAGICLVILMAYSCNMFPVNLPEKQDKFAVGSFLFLYLVIIIFSFVIHGMIRKKAVNAKMVTEELNRCSGILEDQGVDSQKLMERIP